MAIISKIREKSGLAVGIVALSLILFIVGSDLLSGNSSILGGNSQDVGEINGTSIKLQEYQDEIKQAEYEFTLQQGKTPTEQELMSIREQAWNNLVFKHAFKKEFEKLGLVVTEGELVDMVQGDNIHPAVKQSFTNPATGQLDKAQLLNFLQNIKKSAQNNQQAAIQYATWLNFERKLPDDRLRSKFEGMIKGSTYVTKAEAQHEYEAQNTKGEIKYAFIPFTTIVDSTIKVTDEELAAYLKDNQYKYKTQDTRSLEYVQFMVNPSKEDSSEFVSELEKEKVDFAAATNDTAFAASKTDVATSAKLQVVGVADLPSQLSGMAASLSPGQVVGPFVQGPNFTLFKIVGIANEGAYAAKASHILIKPKTPSPEDKIAAYQEALGYLKEIKGGKSFEEMARLHGTDGTAPQGGDLGWFAEGRMVKPFEAAVYAAKGKGLLPAPVETDFGWHLIKVTETKTNLKYKVVSIQKNISASDATREGVYNKANAFRSAVTNAKDFKDLASKDNLTMVQAPSITTANFNVNDIPEARQLVRWAFNDAKLGDVAPEIFDFKDRYLVASLNGESFKDKPTVGTLKDALTLEVRKQKKAQQIIEKINGKAIDAIAAVYAGTVTNTAVDVNFGGNAMQDLGYDPTTIGSIFGSKAGTVSKPIAAESGVIVASLVKVVPAPKIADYNVYKQQVEQRRAGGIQYYVNESLKDNLKVVDNRIKFF